MTGWGTEVVALLPESADHPTPFPLLVLAEHAAGTIEEERVEWEWQRRGGMK